MVRLGKKIEPESVTVIHGKDKNSIPRWELHIKIGDKIIPKYVHDFDEVKRELEWLFLGEWEDS